MNIQIKINNKLLKKLGNEPSLRKPLQKMMITDVVELIHQTLVNKLVTLLLIYIAVVMLDKSSSIATLVKNVAFELYY
jgi:hypothetical protein